MELDHVNLYSGFLSPPMCEIFASMDKLLPELVVHVHLYEVITGTCYHGYEYEFPICKIIFKLYVLCGQKVVGNVNGRSVSNVKV